MKQLLLCFFCFGILHAKEPTFGKNVMATSPHPEATQVGLEILENGGNAIDAAVAMQLVLGAVTPENTGLGGGGTLLYYRKSDAKIICYDGIECAPRSVTSTFFLKQDGSAQEKPLTSIGGKCVGVPGLLKMLDIAHRENGRLKWESLFSRAIVLADEKLARTLTLIAAERSTPFYEGALAQKIALKVTQSKINPGVLTFDDLHTYRVHKREPLSFNYRNFRIASFPPPSCGGIVCAQILGMLENRLFDGLNLSTLNLFSQASGLGFSDATYFIADPMFFSVPVAALTNQAYLSKRGALLKKEGALKHLEPGKAPRTGLPELAKTDATLGDSAFGGVHIACVDKEGNAVNLTTSLGTEYGSKLNVEGFYLNNRLADFSFIPEQDGKIVANRIEPGKRPLSYVTPLFVFDKMKNRLLLVLGSVNGPYTVDYVTLTLLNVLDLKMNIQEAIDSPHIVAIDETLYVEKGTPLLSQIRPLKTYGHKEVHSKVLPSGTCGIQILEDALVGGSDQRR